MEIGDKVFLTNQAQTLIGLHEGVEYHIIDIIDKNESMNPYPIVVGSDELGKDWREFFSEDELILIKDIEIS